MPLYACAPILLVDAEHGEAAYDMAAKLLDAAGLAGLFTTDAGREEYRTPRLDGPWPTDPSETESYGLTLHVSGKFRPQEITE